MTPEGALMWMKFAKVLDTMWHAPHARFCLGEDSKDTLKRAVKYTLEDLEEAKKDLENIQRQLEELS